MEEIVVKNRLRLLPDHFSAVDDPREPAKVRWVRNGLSNANRVAARRQRGEKVAPVILNSAVKTRQLKISPRSPTFWKEQLQGSL